MALSALSPRSGRLAAVALMVTMAPACDCTSLDGRRMPTRPLARRAATHRRTQPTLAVPAALPWVGGCVLAGWSGTPFVIPAIKSGWYDTIEKPPWCPPPGTYAPAWTVLYASIGYAAARVASAASAASRTALVIWSVHLGINLVWAPLFFGLKRIRLAAWWNVLLLAAIAATATSFARVSALSAWVLAPYAGWCIFATALNFDIARRNRQ